MKITIPQYGTFEVPAHKFPELVQFLRSIGAINLDEAQTQLPKGNSLLNG